MIDTAFLVTVLGAGAIAFANGANDNFKGVATLHGAGRLGYGRALAWATLTTFAGSLAASALAAGLVQRFTGKGLVGDAIIASPAFLASVALGSAATVLLATRLGMPVSTTHALTGALLGAGLVVAGPGHIRYATLGSAFVLPLLLSPLLALLMAAAAYGVFARVRRRLRVEPQTCLCVVAADSIVAAPTGAALSTTARMPALHVDTTAACEAHGARGVFGWDARALLDRLHVLSAGAIGFARGLNDTPKIAALLLGIGAVGLHGGVVAVAVGMAAGGLLAGRRVARTLAFDITAMNDGQAFTANLVTAALVTAASPLGLPISTTHVSCGALFGIGAATGQARWPKVAEIFGAWVTTVPLAAAVAAGLAFAARSIPS